MMGLNEAFAIKYRTMQQRADTDSFTAASNASHQSAIANIEQQNAASLAGLRGAESAKLASGVKNDELSRSLMKPLQSILTQGLPASATTTAPTAPPGLRSGKTRITDRKGSPRKDTVPAMLADGEAVLNAGAAEMLGRDRIAQLNAEGAKKLGLRGGPQMQDGVLHAVTGAAGVVIPDYGPLTPEQARMFEAQVERMRSNAPRIPVQDGVRTPSAPRAPNFQLVNSNPPAVIPGEMVKQHRVPISNLPATIPGQGPKVIPGMSSAELNHGFRTAEAAWKRETGPQWYKQVAPEQAAPSGAAGGSNGHNVPPSKNVSRASKGVGTLGKFVVLPAAAVDFHQQASNGYHIDDPQFRKEHPNWTRALELYFDAGATASRVADGLPKLLGMVDSEGRGPAERFYTNALDDISEHTIKLGGKPDLAQVKPTKGEMTVGEAKQLARSTQPESEPVTRVPVPPPMSAEQKAALEDKQYQDKFLNKFSTPEERAAAPIRQFPGNVVSWDKMAERAPSGYVVSPNGRTRYDASEAGIRARVGLEQRDLSPEQIALVNEGIRSRSKDKTLTRIDTGDGSIYRRGNEYFGSGPKPVALKPEQLDASINNSLMLAALGGNTNAASILTTRLQQAGYDKERAKDLEVARIGARAKGGKDEWSLTDQAKLAELQTGEKGSGYGVISENMRRQKDVFAMHKAAFDAAATPEEKAQIAAHWDSEKTRLGGEAGQLDTGELMGIRRNLSDNSRGIRATKGAAVIGGATAAAMLLYGLRTGNLNLINIAKSALLGGAAGGALGWSTGSEGVSESTPLSRLDPAYVRRNNGEVVGAGLRFPESLLSEHQRHMYTGD